MALLLAEGAVVKEMEAAAVAWVCQQLALPFIALKSITDIVDGGEGTRGEFERNLDAAAQTLQTKLHAVLTLVGDRPLSDWCSTEYTMPAPSAPVLPQHASSNGSKAEMGLRRWRGGDWGGAVAMVGMGAMVAGTAVLGVIRVWQR